ncbi:uncharacterized protein LOC107797638 isoform X1 [Nicotiana tabacum]|uniref:Uncharacterized protein isoform X1 n=3 Tax=Nicotiana tabacum TaxID=4097 RepID=A0A1S4AH44_TOBAC|nr:PREDICTED: uncharacterized protein LOC107797638 isoform X1 [Nicotiana tabacum]
MAAENEERVLRKRKRKVDGGTHRKLVIDQKVEVRSVDDGFLGSWHVGAVIGCDDLVRQVKYDHLLSDDGSGNLVEFVTVSPMVDGVNPANQKPVHYRGLIRPLPPPCEFSRWHLHYGQCVDLFYQDAWWEGVIFDHEDCAVERKIFFPDMGDEMKAQVDKLRITQDWDEVTEEWEPRGSWMFLDVIEEIAHLHPLLVSVKQIWYEVQLKKDYENFEWTSSLGDIWWNLVKEVVHDNTKLAINQFFSELNSSQDFVERGRLLEVSEVTLEAKLNLETYFDNSNAPVTEATCKLDTAGMQLMDPNVSHLQPVVKQYVSEGFAPSKKDVQLCVNDVCRSVPLSQKEELSVSPHAFSVLPPPNDDFAGILSSTKSEPLTCTNFKRRRGRPTTKKKRFEGQTPADEPDFCPDAIAKYMPSMSSIKKFKKHLLFLGWKFELVMDCGIIRKRYIAPNGKICQSLSQVCHVLEESKACELVPPVEQRNLYGSPDKSPCAARPPTCSEVPELPSPSEETTIVPEICPQAVIDYCSPKSLHSAYWKSYKHGVRVGDTSLKAKKHLAAIGWKIFFAGKKDRKLRYCSPEGKLFASLRKACRWCAQKWEAESHLPEKVSSPSAAMEFERNSSPAKSSCETLPVGTSPMSLLREPLQNGKVKFCRMTKPRKKRKRDDEKDIHISGLPVSKGKRSWPSLKKGNGIGPHPSACVMRSSKRTRQAAPSSSHKTSRTVLSWLIDNNVVLPHTKVLYCAKKYGNPMAHGQITREGIKCNCCEKIYGLRNFETHAGSSCHRPSANIFLEDGRSLLECQLQMKRKQSVKNTRKEPRAEKKGSRFSTNDYICSVCHYGGELILCDECPSSFHPDCLGMKEVPDGDWFCPSCCCKVCGHSGFDTNRNHFTENNVLICCQCEHKYHARCVRSKGPGKLDNYPEGNWFCNKSCELIFLGMHHLLGKPVIVGDDNLTWTLLKYIEPDDSGSDIVDYESSVENYSRLSVALDVMHECFEPVKEPHTRRDIVEDVIFSRRSELNRLNFQGFYTVLLGRNDELITVATVRVYGEKVAEIPLVATQFQHRRLGMCRILMNELEKKLMELGVERLVLPAVPAVLDTWTASFGFSVMKESERVNFLDYTFLDFQGTIMCQKILQKNHSVVSSVLTEAQQTHSDNTNSKDNVDLDDNTAVSEVFQAKQVEGCATVDQGSMETSKSTSTGVIDVAVC